MYCAIVDRTVMDADIAQLPTTVTTAYTHTYLYLCIDMSPRYA